MTLFLSLIPLVHLFLLPSHPILTFSALKPDVQMSPMAFVTVIPLRRTAYQKLLRKPHGKIPFTPLRQWRSNIPATMVLSPARDAQTSQSESSESSNPITPAAGTIQIYDTTLRDGAQGEGISLTVADKLKIATRLDDFGVHYIEGGWPGSNPKDAAFFEECVNLKHSRLVAFGSTRYKNTTCELDRNVQALAAANTPAVTLVGKAWDMQVTVVLEASLQENLDMIFESVLYFKQIGREVMLDAEHFFDGYKNNPEYAMSCLKAAVDGGVDVLVLCDTNGGCVPWEVERITATVANSFPGTRIGIHCHNDMELAVANSISAVHGGATLVQGTVNGYGERTGNANLMSIIPTLQLKMAYSCVGDALQRLTTLSRFVDEIANQQPVSSRPFVGNSSFAHKGGLHVAAVLKNEDTYQHIDPKLVGNERRILVSELAGRRNIMSKAEELGLIPSQGNPNAKEEWSGRAKVVLGQVKELENKGYSFEGAEASLELMLRRTIDGYRPPFELLDFSVTTDNKRLHYGSNPDEAPTNESVTQATVKLALLGPEGMDDMCPTKICLEVAEGNGPIDALNAALGKALLQVYRPLQSISLSDYKVRILDNENGTAATTRVLVEFRDSTNGKSWTTVYAHPNIIVASVNAIMDGFEVAMWDALPMCIRQ